jgi:hypothetical protein
MTRTSPAPGTPTSEHAELSVPDLMELPSASIGEGSGEQGLERT